MDYRYLTETKNEFNNFLHGILVPHLYHGIKGMLKYSENVFNQIEMKKKKGFRIENPGITNIFKKTLDGITSLNNHEIEEEYLRIKNSSGCAEWFDNLVKASFKSYVLFLTWDPQISNSKYSDNSIYDLISIKDFLHKCYVISCNYFKNNPELFISKNSKKDVFDVLKMCIDMGIKKSLPYNQIIEEYLQIEFDKTNDVNTKEIQNIKSMVFSMMNQKKYGSRPHVDNLLVEDTNADEFVNIEDSEYKRAELENFIMQEKINEQNKLNKENLNMNAKREQTETSDNNQLGGNNDENSIGTSTSASVSVSGTFEKSNATSTQTNNVNESNENTGQSSANASSSTMMSRSELKTREIEELMSGGTHSSRSAKSKSSDTSDAIEQKHHQTQAELEESNVSETSENLQSNKSLSSMTKSVKSTITNILTSPPIIRSNKNKKLNDFFELDQTNNLNKNEGKKSKQKKNIKVIKHNNNNYSDKFDQVESYYDNIIKI